MNNKCTEMTSQVPARTRVSELHAHLVCVLCGGFYVDATTIVECLHTFCKTCIVKFLDNSKFCPMCDVQVHKSKPLVNLRPDKTLQDLVYKIIPGSYGAEMQRRREFYESQKEKGVDTNKIPPEERGEPKTHEFFSPEDSISLSLEYYTGEESENQESESTPKENGAQAKPEPEVKKERENNHKRFLHCPAAVGMRHLKKFIRLKFGLSPEYKVDIIYEGECLRDEFTLMDVAYTFSWKRNSAMRFYYRIYERPKYVPKFSDGTADRTVTDNNDEPPMKRPRLLSSDGATTPSNSTSNSTPANSTDQKPSQPPAEPVETAQPPPTLASEKAESMEPVVVKPKEEKRSRSRSTELQRLEASAIPVSRPKTPVARPKTPVSRPKTPVSRPKTPKPPKEKKDTPRVESKRDSSTSTPKIISQPPKPIMPGQKPPSQTALLLQQRIMQQRQQQQQKLQLQKQQQQKMLLQKQQQMGMHQKQIPQLNKLQTSQKQLQQMKLNRASSSPSTTTKSLSVSTSTQSTSKQTTSVQTSVSSAKPQPPPVSKPAVPSPSVTKPSVTTSAPTKPVSTPAVSKPSNSQPTMTKPVQTPAPKMSPSAGKSVPSPMKQVPSTVKPSPSTVKPPPSTVKSSPGITKPPQSTAQANGKPATSPTSPKPAVTSSEPRRGDNLIEKEKMSPVVVIERHHKKPQKNDKSSPSVQKDKSPPPVKPKQSKIGPETTLTVAPGGSDTKLRLIKRPATSPASGAPVAKKIASETPKPASTSSALLEPLEIRTSGDKPRHDDFGALDLSGKSSRKSDSPCSSHSSEAASPPAPSPPEPRTSPAPKPTPPPPTPPPPRTQSSSIKPTKSSSPQTIMSIAQTLVNRQLSNLGFNGDGGRSPGSPHSQGSSSPSSLGSVSVGSGMSFRNLMTLSDTAVQLRNSMQSPQQTPQFQHRAPTPQPRMRLPTPQQHSSARPTYNKTSTSSGNIKSPPPPSIRIPTVPNMNKSSPPVRENNPMMSPSRVSRINDIFPPPSQVKPGPNQSVRHIPNPALLFRQQANRMQQQSQPPSCKDEITITPAKNPSNPPLSSIRKIENLTRNIGEGKAVNTGLGARVTAEATQ